MADPDDLIVPGRQPRKTGGVRRIFDVPPGQAPTIKLAPGSLIVIDDIGIRLHEEGPFIILPLERWVRTLTKAIAKADQAIEEDSRQVRRAVARSITQDRRN